MKTFLRVAVCQLFVCTAVLTACGEGYGNPSRFEKEISSFEKADAESMPPEGAVLCIGSSSMRMWHPTIKEDLAPLTVIPRGFGGSTMNDLLHFTDRVVIPYKPRAILVYEGDNDAKAGISVELFRQTFDAFVDKVHKSLPQTRIYLLAVKPSISRIKLMPVMREFNKVMADAASKDPLLTYIDVFNPMLDESGNPLPDIFKTDNLHMNRKGYEIWREVVRPVLVEAEKKYEQ